jgi:hypothetical protein
VIWARQDGHVMHVVHAELALAVSPRGAYARPGGLQSRCKGAELRHAVPAAAPARAADPRTSTTSQCVRVTRRRE